jgi:hypothetical protein
MYNTSYNMKVLLNELVVDSGILSFISEMHYEECRKID